MFAHREEEAASLRQHGSLIDLRTQRVRGKRNREVVEYGIANSEGDMLRTTIQTTDEGTGKELPIPADLLAKVQRAAELLAEVFRKVGEKFDIEARWRFEPRKENYTAFLRLTSAEGGTSDSEFPGAELDGDDSIRRWLSTATSAFVNILSEEVNRRIAGIFRGIYTTLAELRNEYAGEIAQPEDRGTLQPNS